MRKKRWVSTEFKDGKPYKVNYREETPEEEKKREEAERKRLIGGLKFSIASGIVFAALTIGAMMISPDWRPATTTDALMYFGVAFVFFFGIGAYFTVKSREERGPTGERIIR